MTLEVVETAIHENNLYDVYDQYLTADLFIVSSWAKKDLFRFCKFVQDNKEDLSTTSKIYLYFKQTFQTSDVLKGIKASKTDIRINPERYLDKVWALADKKGTISRGLAHRRSAIYTVMQHRFAGKKDFVCAEREQRSLTDISLHTDMCKLCARNALVLPACEAFQKRLEDPNHYFLFYKFFLRSAVGDEEEWKRKSTSHKSVDNTSSLSSALDEAFALVMLQNNYFSWLLEAKEEFGNSLITDYDSSHRAPDGTPLLSLIQYTHMKVCVIDLQDGEEENGYVWKQGNEEHDTATSDVMQAVMRTRVTVQHSQNYNDIVESIKEIEEEEDLNDNEKKRKMKRRKIMKGLRPFTGKKEINEKRKRGWSLRGYKQLMDI